MLRVVLVRHNRMGIDIYFAAIVFVEFLWEDSDLQYADAHKVVR